MKVMVCVKRTSALGDDVEFDPGGWVDPDYLDYGLNEWDATATAEGVRLRRLSNAGELIVVTVGDKDAEETLFECLAMGADRAIRVSADSFQFHDPLMLARLLASVAKSERPDLILCGAKSSDAAHGSTGSALAAILGWPCGTVVTRIQSDGIDGTLVVQRELEGGLLDVVEVDLPALLTIQTGIIERPYVSLRAIQRARGACVSVVEARSIETGPPGYRIRRMSTPPKSQARMIEGGALAAAQAITKLIRASTA